MYFSRPKSERENEGTHRVFFLSRVFATLLFFVVLFGGADVAYAGFGITPPYVQSDRLTRGSTYDQRITLVRSDPNTDLNAEITIAVPGAGEWITVDRGLKFLLPKGATQVPIIFTVHVPKEADFKEYKGAIRIRTSATDSKEGGVSIALGAQVDVDLKVVDKIFDFEVRRIRLADVEEGHTKWGLFFPGKIRFFMTIANTGNTEYGPTKVTFDIYDAQGETLLETTQNTNHIEKVPPFGFKEVLAELPTRLPAGTYQAKYTVFKGKEIAQQNQVTLSVMRVGTIPGYEGYGFLGLSLADKIKVIMVLGIPTILILVIVVMFILRLRKRRQNRSSRPFNRPLQ